MYQIAFLQDGTRRRVSTMWDWGEGLRMGWNQKKILAWEYILPPNLFVEEMIWIITSFVC